jgi:nucleotide-binding universal stress UspA family protein
VIWRRDNDGGGEPARRTLRRRSRRVSLRCHTARRIPNLRAINRGFDRQTQAMNRLLLAYNGGSSSRQALERTGEMATVLGARVSVVSVAPLVYGQTNPWDDRNVHSEQVEEARELLRRYRVEPRLIVRLGDIATTIRVVARQERADIILLGAGRRHGALGTLLFGSVRDEVVSKTDATVFIARERPGHAGAGDPPFCPDDLPQEARYGFGPILVVCDGSDAGRLALHSIATIAHALRTPVSVVDAPGAASGGADRRAGHGADEAATPARVALRVLGLRGVRAGFIRLLEEPARAIERLAAEGRFGTVVLAPRRQAPLERLFTESLWERLTARTRANVVVAR